MEVVSPSVVRWLAHYFCRDIRAGHDKHHRAIFLYKVLEVIWQGDSRYTNCRGEYARIKNYITLFNVLNIVNINTFAFLPSENIGYIFCFPEVKRLILRMLEKHEECIVVVTTLGIQLTMWLYRFKGNYIM